MTHVTGEEVRRVRQQLGEDQTAFGARFGKTRRTIIRWEKGGAQFSDWGGWNREDRKTPADLWRDLAKLAAEKAAKNSPQKKRNGASGKDARPRPPSGRRLPRKSARKSPARNRASRRKAKKSKRVKR